MKVIRANTADRGLQAALTELNKQGNFIETASRNGPVRRFRGPATIMWTRPQHRVSFDPLRDANPAFHLFESLWMLSGENDVERPKYFASAMGAFSDDGITFNGAYGHRWVNHFGGDQIREYVIPALRKNPEDRRVVLQMWDGDHDMKSALAASKDVPCNLGCTFDAAQGDGRLHLNVFNRSNDLVWGATGANVVQFSMLQEYVASACGMGIGVYEQISTNSHLYLELNEVSKKMLAVNIEDPNRDLPYAGHLSFLKDKSDGTPEEWQTKFDADIALLMVHYKDVGAVRFQTKFFREVVYPVIGAFNLYKNGDELEAAMYLLLQKNSKTSFEEPWYTWSDWSIATYQWLERRVKNRNSLAKKALEAKDETEFETVVKKMWTKATRMGDTFVIPGASRPVKAALDPHRMVKYRGMTAENMPDAIKSEE